MAWTTAVRKIVDGPKRAVIHVTGVSDGSNEISDLAVVDVNNLNDIGINKPCTKVQLEKIKYTTVGMTSVILEWEANADVVAWVLPGAQEGEQDFSKFGGITNNAGSGITGDLVLTTVGGNDAATDRLSLIIEVSKDE